MDNQKQQIQPNEEVFNDFDKANDVLNSVKKLIENYNTFAIEAGSEQLHQHICQLKSEAFTLQRGLFNVLYQKGWYQLTPEDQTKLTQAYNQHVNMANQLK